MSTMVARALVLVGIAGCTGADTPLVDDVVTDTTDATDAEVSDSGTTDSTEPPPEFGVLSVTVEGRTYELELLAPVSLADAPSPSMEWRAEHTGRVARLSGFLLDEQPITAREYPVGQWGGNFERFEISLRVISQGTTSIYTTPEGRTTPGTLTLSEIDREGGTVTHSWVADLEKRDLKETVLGTVTVESTLVDGPMTVY